MVLNFSKSHGRKVAPDFPVQWPLGLAVGTWIVVAFGGYWFFPVGSAPPHSGLTLFRIALWTFMVLITVYPLATMLLGILGQEVPVVLKRPFQIFAWCAPFCIALFLAGVASLSSSFLTKAGLFLAMLAVMAVSPMALLLGAGLILVTAMQLLRPLWWWCGRPESAHFKVKSPTELAQSPHAPANFSGVGFAHAADPPSPLQSTPIADQSSAPSKSPAYEFEWRHPKSRFKDLAGMAKLKTELTAAINPFRGYIQGAEVSDRNGILLSGPPGNGKTAFAMAIAGELELPFVKVSGVDLTSKWINESAAMLKELFRQAGEQACVIFIDEFDSVAKDRGNGQLSEEDRKLVTALLTLVDEARLQRIVLVAATNYVDLLDKAAIREGRFDFRIEVPYPDLEARIGILQGMLAKFKVSADSTTVQHVATLWQRRSVAFIESTVKRLRDSGKGSQSRHASVDDFKQASRDASRRAGNIPSSGAKLSELILPDSVRRETASLVYRLKNWETIAEQGGEPPTGVLLYGPPGTGKTNLVRALARELEYWHVFEVNSTEVLHDPRTFTDIVELAAEHRPAIVFMDEADELLKDRTQSHSVGATNQILKTMDGLMGKVPEVVFIAATNNAAIMDGAALRGGRFAERIYMGRLNGVDLVAFLDKEFASKKQVIFARDLTPGSLAQRLGESSQADALAILRRAINSTFSEGKVARAVSMRDIEAAIESSGHSGAGS